MSLTAKKSLGQNFLRNKKILACIVESSHISPSEIALEVGAGEGDLTAEILSTGAKVFAIEKDHRAIPFLEEKFQKEIESGQLTLKEGDALEESIESFITPSLPYRVIANIPYYITGALIKQFLTADHKPLSVTLVIQKEVAERIARSPKESILSLSVKAYGTPRFIKKIPAKFFSPAPKVDSAIIHIDTISNTFFQENNITESEFFEIIKTAFGQKRKTLAKNLSALFPREIIEKALVDLSLNPKTRAEDVTLTEWGNLISNIKNHRV